MHFLLLFLTTLTFGPQAYAQVATASFAADSIGENPAAAATRDWGILGVFVDYAKTETNINPGLAVSWDQSLEVQKNEIIFAGRKWLLVPEGYVSFGKGTKTITPHFESTTERNKNELMNYQINLGVNYFERLKFGVQYIKPHKQLDFGFSFSNASESYSYKDSFDGTVEGVGAGATAEILRGFNLGLYYLKLQEKGEVASVYQSGSAPAMSGTFIRDLSYSKKGIGLSYLTGNKRSTAFRFEISYGVMDPISEQKPDQPKLKNGEQFVYSAEVLWWKLVGGLNLQRSKASYINFRQYIDFIMDENNISPNDYVVTYGGFLTLKTKAGHSLGIRGSYSNRKDKIKFIGEDKDAEIKSYSIGANYAYLF